MANRELPAIPVYYDQQSGGTKAILIQPFCKVSVDEVADCTVPGFTVEEFDNLPEGQSITLQIEETHINKGASIWLRTHHPQTYDTQGNLFILLGVKSKPPISK